MTDVDEYQKHSREMRSHPRSELHGGHVAACDLADAALAEQAETIRRLSDDLMHTWVECPECESTSIRCHMCGFVSDGSAFLHEESTP